MDAPFSSIKRSIARPRLAGESDEARLAYLRELIGTEDRPGGAQAHDCLEFINLLLKRWPREGGK
jgi:hypothetical protein